VRLHGESLDYLRQVIELPEPMPVEVIEHRVIRRYCPKCQKWRSPKLDLARGGQAGGEQAGGGQVLGRARIGVRLVSLIATLRHSLRLPFERIQGYLETFHEFRVSVGEIVYLLDQVRKATIGEVESLKAEIRASKVLHADETGWRENGVNGYLWSFSTPGGSDGRDTGRDTGREAIRYYEFDPSRSQAVPRRILGDKFKGHLVSDFYCGYNDYPSKHQRCWVHLFRDLHELKEAHADKPEVLAWAESLRALYRACARSTELARALR
jgi:transposase